MFIQTGFSSQKTTPAFDSLCVVTGSLNSRAFIIQILSTATYSLHYAEEFQLTIKKD